MRLITAAAAGSGYATVFEELVSGRHRYEVRATWPDLPLTLVVQTTSQVAALKLQRRFTAHTSAAAALHWLAQRPAGVPLEDVSALVDVGAPSMDAQLTVDDQVPLCPDCLASSHCGAPPDFAWRPCAAGEACGAADHVEDRTDRAADLPRKDCGNASDDPIGDQRALNSGSPVTHRGVTGYRDITPNL